MAAPETLPASIEGALDAALQSAATAFEVWLTRDNVATLMHRFECTEGARLLVGVAARRHIQVVTERSALAVLVRAALSNEHFTRLCKGFERPCLY